MRKSRRVSKPETLRYLLSQIHRDQPGGTEPRRGALAQEIGHGRALDQRRQPGGEDDAAEVPTRGHTGPGASGGELGGNLSNRLSADQLP